MRTFRSTKPLSHEAAACGREDRHRTGGAVILVWVGITLVRMAEILRPLRPEARQMCVDLHGRSAEASRIVQARLPIYAAIVTQFVTHLGDLATPSESRWQSLESGAPTSRTSGCTSPAKTIPRLADLEAKERGPARTSQETVAAGLAERTYESRNDEPAGSGDGSGGAARS